MSLLRQALGVPKPAMDTGPPPRSCIVCTEVVSPERGLLKPCRCCHTDYCLDCLVDMFTGATTDSTRMPPHCCSFLQIHTVLAGLSDEEAAAYRAKFEEWITVDKTYCPVPTCSTFIPERLLPNGEAKTISLQSSLSDLVQKVASSPPARFFRGELPITELPGYAAVVPQPMDLSIIQARVELYKSTVDLTIDMSLIVSNAKTYNGPEHPVAKTADELFQRYLDELSTATDAMIKLASDPAAPSHFLCPKCHIGICVRCKQIEHGRSACDTTAEDHELAMLEQFRYKRCPLCKHAVRKMFGCSHMQCVCGAHWCYYCQRSINECDGACEERDESADEDEDEYDEDDDGSNISEPVGDEPAHAAQPPPPEQPAIQEGRVVPASAESNTTIGPPPADSGNVPRSDIVVNLDAGGTRRWAETGLDFGEEPDEGTYAQIWSCSHAFHAYEVAEDRENHGDLTKMECNRCFAHVKPQEPTQPTSKGRKDATKTVLDTSRKSVKATAVSLRVLDVPETGEGQTEQAFECSWCRLVVCEACRHKFKTGEDDE